MTPEENALLDEAVEKWDNVAEFSHSKVAQVKAVFGRLMPETPVTHMEGSRYADGIVLHDPNVPQTAYYTLIRNREGWKCRSFRMEIDCSVVFCTSDMHFKEYLTLLSNSEREQMLAQRSNTAPQ